MKKGFKPAKWGENPRTLFSYIQIPRNLPNILLFKGDRKDVEYIIRNGVGYVTRYWSDWFWREKIGRLGKAIFPRIWTGGWTGFKKQPF
jgi:hypothetical protein